MKFRKIVLLFMILAFGVIVEGISVTRQFVSGEEGGDLGREGGRLGRIFRNLEIDGEFPFSRNTRFRGPSHDFTDSQTTDAAGITSVEVSNEYGDVTVKRTEDPKAQISIGLRKEVFTRTSESAESQSDKVKLQVKRDGNVLRISTTRDPRADYRIKTHFDIDTPLPLDTRITNRHGKIVVEGARAVDLTGEYDDLRVVDVTGDCVAKNRHGNLEVISAVHGCRVEVEYGDAHVERLLAPSKIDIKHGNLNALDLASLDANLTFGDLQAQKISGSLTAEGQHASLKIDDVKGDVNLNNQGDIDIQNILGRIDINNQRGHIKLLKAAAQVLIKNTFDEVAVADVAGLLEVQNQHGSIRAQRFLKGGRFETDSEDVDVSDFSGALNIITKRGDVAVKPMRPGISPVDISVDIGDITLALSDTVNALIDASVERGDVEASVGALKSTETGKRMMKATIGNGGPLLRLRSRLGDIKLTEGDDFEVSEPDTPDAPEIDTRAHTLTSPRLGADPMPVAPKLPSMPAPATLPRVSTAPKVAPAPVAVPAPPEPPATPTPNHR